jgi:hypothetical protein
MSSQQVTFEELPLGQKNDLTSNSLLSKRTKTGYTIRPFDSKIFLSKLIKFKLKRIVKRFGS